MLPAVSGHLGLGFDSSPRNLGYKTLWPTFPGFVKEKVMWTRYRPGRRENLPGGILTPVHVDREAR